MKTAYEIRRENLGVLEKRHGGLGNLNEAIGRSRKDSSLRQIRGKVRLSNGSCREMGDSFAREIERKLELGRGWMDNEHPEEAGSRGPEVLAFPVKRVVFGRDGAVFEDLSGDEADTLFLSPAWFRRTGLAADAAKAILVGSDCMAPRIMPGSVVLLDASDAAPASRGVYCVRYQEELRLCSLAPLISGSLAVGYENPVYPAERLPSGWKSLDGFSVVGRVVSVHTARII